MKNIYMLVLLLCMLMGNAEVYAGDIGIPLEWRDKQQESAEISGCIKKNIKTCVESVQAVLSIPDEQVRMEIAKNDKRDVNGKLIVKNKMVTLFGNARSGNYKDGQMVTVHFDDNGIVTLAGMTLRENPGLAKTEDEYDKTGLYEAMTLLLGSDCPELTRKQAHIFFENEVKNRIVSEGKKTVFSDTGARVSYFKKALNIPMCGRLFSFTNSFGYDSSDIDVGNPQGAYRHTDISFK